MSPTIYDIARVAGVSKSTVSRVLNKQTNISPEAREKVLRAIEELQYQPNKLARADLFGFWCHYGDFYPFDQNYGG